MDTVHYSGMTPCAQDELLLQLLDGLERAHYQYCHKTHRRFSLDSYWYFLRVVMPRHLRPVVRHIHRATADPTLQPWIRRNHLHAIIRFLGTDTDALIELIPFRNQAARQIKALGNEDLEEITEGHTEPHVVSAIREQHCKLANETLLALHENWQAATGRRATQQQYQALIIAGNCWTYTNRLKAALGTNDPMPQRLLLSYRVFETRLAEALIEDFLRSLWKRKPDLNATRKALTALRNLRRHAWEDYLFVEALRMSKGN